MQKTILAPVEFTGIGLHTGQLCTIRLSPIEEFGYFIKSSDCITKIEKNTISGGMLGTNVTLENGQVVRTVEHLLAAIVSVGLTNVVIEVLGDEIPIMDGSSQEFATSLELNGFKTLERPIPKIHINSSMKVVFDDKWIELVPRDDNLQLFNLTIDFQNPVVDEMPQTISYIHTRDNFMRCVAQARTFGFQNEIESLLAMKLCIGGSTNNAVVITDDGVLNPDGLRFNNELVAHKLLDLIGDLSPILPMLGGFELNAYKCGHMLNNSLLLKLYDLQ
ncbi:UDP-3-O-acyl-N-acetylglucosamine deacetylase [Vibrio sp. D431a]|uniref:UDP-3-O-acyl-N-acetylglucosamine deacetylase n=1 Tax=Vibrio sp. D431a TaxID=2837388 RepID=UPI0025576997|nr:UDP-3-O-acyl-N-acetylglucosamine deacetylase [Vibrio sp. D431a]MDK9793874.1 UDP-3-O-[3-hydroxymyristoyl] N-acetylglucosamine deacetylase [Vibrio sp. D431a]